MLADASAEPLADMHVAVGRPERGLTAGRAGADARDGGLARAADPGPRSCPTPLLLLPPDEGLVRRDAGAVADYRGPAAAFSVEPELAELLVGERAGRGGRRGGVRGGARRRSVAAPPLNLRQGAFAAPAAVEGRAGRGCAASRCSALALVAAHA